MTAILTNCGCWLRPNDIPIKAYQRIVMIEAAATRMGEQMKALIIPCARTGAWRHRDGLQLRNVFMMQQIH
ncbi:MAG: hypothetical protein IPP22_03445 [Nitrosomonas sp.]|nr:hypothetical protein [Nitrosomonas sp.]